MNGSFHNRVFAFITLAISGLILLVNNQPEIQPADPPNKNLSRFAPLPDNPHFKTILALQESFKESAKRIKPSVVSINNLKKTDSKSQKNHHYRAYNQNWLQKFRKWFLGFSERRFFVEHLGSGILWKSNGIIITNYHVVKKADSLLVKLMDGRELRAELKSYDYISDLALLKIFSFKDFPIPKLGSSRNLKTGEWVIAVGNPYGLEGTVTVGVVSRIGVTEFDPLELSHFIQTDAAINPGNSGGPLSNLNGKVIGINTIHKSLGPGLGVTIPIETVVKISNKLLENGSVDRGWLGVSVQPLTYQLAASFNLSSIEAGLLINRIEKQAPAEDGGLKRGDIIVEYDGNPVAEAKFLKKKIINSKIGKPVLIKVIRDGQEKIVTVKIGKMDPGTLAKSQPSKFYALL